MSATLKGRARAKLGSRDARKLRLQGFIPASVQGEGKENLAIAIEREGFATARRAHEHLFDIELEGADIETALVRELQWDAFGERVMHVEFRRVVRGQKTTAEVELDFIGHPKGGLLNHLVTHVTIVALPSEIPDTIEVRVDELELGGTILAGELVLPEGVDLDMAAETPVAMVITPHAEAEPTDEAEGEGEGEAAAATPETEE